MNFKKFLVLATVFAASMFWTGCSDDDDNRGGGGGGGNRRELVSSYSSIEVNFTNNTTTEWHARYEYNSRGDLTIYTLHRNGVERSRTENEYDSRGNLTKQASYTDGVLRLIHEFDYRGNITKGVVYNSSGIETSRSETEYVYNYAGNIIRQTSYVGGIVVSRIEREYDANVMIKETQTSYTGGIEVSRIEREYDANGMTKGTTYVRGFLSSTTVLERDDSGRSTLQITYNSLGVEISRLRIEYNGNQTKQTNYSNGVLSSTTVIERDSRGNFIKAVDYNSSGVETSRTENEYDANGNRTMQTRYTNGVEIARNEFEYDSRGNRIRQTTYSGGVKSNERIWFDFEYIRI
jgi:hypothetical protein